MDTKRFIVHFVQPERIEKLPNGREIPVKLGRDDIIRKAKEHANLRSQFEFEDGSVMSNGDDHWVAAFTVDCVGVGKFQAAKMANEFGEVFGLKTRSKGTVVNLPSEIWVGEVKDEE